MKYQTFGKTGLEISKIALGTWGMGGCGWDNYDEEIKADAVAAAVESGINLIDTSLETFTQAITGYQEGSSPLQLSVVRGGGYGVPQLAWHALLAAAGLWWARRTAHSLRER